MRPEESRPAVREILDWAEAIGTPIHPTLLQGLCELEFITPEEMSGHNYTE